MIVSTTKTKFITKFIKFSFQTLALALILSSNSLNSGSKASLKAIALPAILFHVSTLKTGKN
jgi:hypothetical protein